MTERKLTSHVITSGTFKMVPRARSSHAMLRLPSREAASEACKSVDMPWLRPEALEVLKELPETQGRIDDLFDGQKA